MGEGSDETVQRRLARRGHDARAVPVFEAPADQREQAVDGVLGAPPLTAQHIPDRGHDPRGPESDTLHLGSGSFKAVNSYEDLITLCRTNSFRAARGFSPRTVRARPSAMCVWARWVHATDPEAGQSAAQRVTDTFRHDTTRLVGISIGGGLLISTAGHQRRGEARRQHDGQHGEKQRGGDEVDGPGDRSRAIDQAMAKSTRNASCQRASTGTDPSPPVQGGTERGSAPPLRNWQGALQPLADHPRPHRQLCRAVRRHGGNAGQGGPALPERPADRCRPTASDRQLSETETGDAGGITARRSEEREPLRPPPQYCGFA